MKVIHTPSISLEMLNDDSDTVAQCTLSNYEDGMVITSLYTHRAYRNQGYARKLLQYVLDTYGSVPIYIEPDPTEDVITKSQLATFYRTLGFRAIGNGLMKNGH